MPGNIREIMGECEVMDIISFGRLCDMLRPSSYVDFTNEIKELRRVNPGGPADIRSIKFSCSKFCFPMDGCNVFECLDELQ